MTKSVVDAESVLLSYNGGVKDLSLMSFEFD